MGLYAAGGTASDPVLIQVNGGEQVTDGHFARDLVQPPPGPGPIESVTGLPGEIMLYGGPLDTPAVGLWAQERADMPYREVSPLSGAWFRPMFDDETNYRVVGASEANGQWRLHAWILFDQWVKMDGGSTPVFGVTPGTNTVLSSATEVGVMVAINDVSDGALAPEIWWLGDVSDLPESARWERESIPSAPDQVTDLVCWALGCWVAGSRDHEPVVYDFDEAGGAEMDLPTIMLDPANPVVRIAQYPLGDWPMVLAVQATEGPMVWTRTAGGWQPMSAPPGTLMAARQWDYGIYLIIDEVLWFRPS